MTARCMTAGCRGLAVPGGTHCPRCTANRLAARGERAALGDLWTAQAPIAPSSETSVKAAAVAGKTRGERTGKVLEYVRRAGAEGRTRPEIEVGLSIPINSVCSIVNRLLSEGAIGINREGDPGVRERTNPKTGASNEVLLAEEFVERWKGTARRDAPDVPRGTSEGGP